VCLPRHPAVAYLYLVRRMRPPPLALFALVSLTALAKEPERIKAAGGQTIIKEFYDDGTIKTITRLNPDGSLLGTLFHNTKRRGDPRRLLR
jgi:hypothetical protein